MAELVEASVGIGVADGAGMHGLLRPVLRHHAIARRGRRGLELLHVTLQNGAEVLPVFTSETAAEEFLASGGFVGDWYARECYGGELVSLLLGLYAGIDGVLIDPCNGSPADGCVPENFVYWNSFVGYLLGEGQSVPQPVPHDVAPAGST